MDDLAESGASSPAMDEFVEQWSGLSAVDDLAEYGSITGISGVVSADTSVGLSVT